MIMDNSAAAGRGPEIASGGMPEIEKLAVKLALVRDDLKTEVAAMEAERQEIERKYLPKIRRLARTMRERKADLEATIDANRALFERPKSREMHGLKLGLRKGSGAVEFEDEEQVIKLIEKKLPEDQHDLLIQTTKKLLKKAVMQLEARELAMIGCTVESTGDVVFVKDTDSAVDKLVKALLKSTADEVES